MGRKGPVTQWWPPTAEDAPRGCLWVSLPSAGVSAVWGTGVTLGPMPWACGSGRRTHRAPAGHDDAPTAVLKSRSFSNSGLHVFVCSELRAGLVLVGPTSKGRCECQRCGSAAMCALPPAPDFHSGPWNC